MIDITLAEFTNTYAKTVNKYTDVSQNRNTLNVILKSASRPTPELRYVHYRRRVDKIKWITDDVKSILIGLLEDTILITGINTDEYKETVVTPLNDLLKIRPTIGREKVLPLESWEISFLILERSYLLREKVVK